MSIVPAGIPFNQIDRRTRILLFCVFLLSGLSIFLFGVPYHSTFPTNGNLFYASALTLSFLAATFLVGRSARWRVFRPVAYAFFIASCANWLLTIGLFNFIIQTDDPMKDIATDKLAQFLAIVPAILVLTKIGGKDLGSIYLQRGNLKRGLIFGLSSFVFFAIVAIFMPQESELTLDMALASLPWILLFVFANAMMEELWFRAIFLRKYDRFLGIGPAVLLTALIFGLSHIPATYVSAGQALMFGLLVFVLGLVGAYAMQKSDSIWGPILFHAGYDLVVIAPIVASIA